MKATAHGAHLVQLTRYGLINCYFVQEDDGLTLVDTGMGGTAEAILKAATQLGRPIVRIVLTHAHSDHVGSLDALRARLPQAECSIGVREAALLAGDWSVRPDEPQTPIKGSKTAVTTRPDRLLQPGDRVGSLEVIASPGHTPGHIALLDTRDRTAIVGDTFASVGGLVVSSMGKWWFPLPALATWHKPTVIASAHAIQQLRPAQLAPGHGRVLGSPHDVIAYAIAAAEQRLERHDGAK